MQHNSGRLEIDHCSTMLNSKRAQTQLMIHPDRYSEKLRGKHGEGGEFHITHSDQEPYFSDADKEYRPKSKRSIQRLEISRGRNEAYPQDNIPGPNFSRVKMKNSTSFLWRWNPTKVKKRQKIWQELISCNESNFLSPKSKKIRGSTG